MATVSTIRDGLKTRLATISGLRAHDVWPNQVNAPAALVKPLAMSMRQAMGSTGKRVWTFEITLLADSVNIDLARAQDALDAYLDASGATSVIAVIEGDKTLGGIVTTLDVLGWSDYGTMEVPPESQSYYMGAKFEITVWE